MACATWCAVAWPVAAGAEDPGGAVTQAEPASQPPQDPKANAEAAKAQAKAPADPFADAVARSRPRQGTQAEDDAANPDSRGATFVTEHGLVETVTVYEGLVETKQVEVIAGSKKIKRFGAIDCGEHKRLTISNVAIVADGPALKVSGKCQVTMVNSFVVSRTGPAVVLEGKKAKVTLDHCTVVGTKADGATVAANVGRRATLTSTRSWFTGKVKSRKRDFKRTETRVDVPPDEVKKKKRKKKRRKKKRRS